MADFSSAAQSLPADDNPSQPSFAETPPVPVLMTVRELNFGGIERDVTNIALHLDRDRFEVHVASYFPFGIRYDELRASGIPVIALPIGAAFLSRTTIRAAVVLRQYIQSRRIRIVHAWDNSSVLAVSVARLCGVPVVLSSVLGHRHLTKPSTVKLLRVMDRMSDAVVVNCDALLHHLAEDEAVPLRKLHVCRNGINIHQFFPGPRDLPQLREVKFVVGTVAVLRPVKAIDLLLEAFAQIQCCLDGMKLVIVGDGPELSRLQAVQRRLGLETSCMFVPGADDIARWLRAMDIFVLPSLSEGLCNTLLEAMACGRAVVATRVGGTPELLGDNERGLLCRPGDARDLAGKLQLLINDPVLRNALADRASNFVRSEMTAERAARTLSEIYCSLLS